MSTNTKLEDLLRKAAPTSVEFAEMPTNKIYSRLINQMKATQSNWSISMFVFSISVFLISTLAMMAFAIPAIGIFLALFLNAGVYFLLRRFVKSIF